MSQVSPYARSTAERSHNRQAIAMLLSIIAAVFFAVVWLVDPSLLFHQAASPEQREDSSQTTVAQPETNTVVTKEKSAVDWAASIAAVEQELPNSNSPELQQLRLRLRTVVNVLEAEKLSSDAESSIQQTLNELHQQAVMLSAQSDRPSVNAEGFTEGVNSTAQSILLAEQTAIRQAREQAERETRRKQEPAIRAMGLEVRDQQDKATDLRRQIAEMQREQKEFQAKAARAEALGRNMSDVKRYLSPFTSPGYLQPKSDRNAWDTERTADAKPVSLARLKRLGALEATMEGLERLYIFGGGKNAVLNNSRPLASFPEYAAYYLKKPNVLQAVKRAQQLLRDHGQALVEEQLLSP